MAFVTYEIASKISLLSETKFLLRGFQVDLQLKLYYDR